MRRRTTQTLRGLFEELVLERETLTPGAEHDIQNGCLDWLNTLPGVAVWRRNVGAGFFGEATAPGRRRFVRFGQPGESDLCGIGPVGVYIAIEVKVAGNIPTTNQLLWLDMVQQHGGIAFVVHSLEECVARMRAAFIDRGWTWKASWNI